MCDWNCWSSIYEQEYEIYGDIRGASNSFKAEAYEQGKGEGGEEGEMGVWVRGGVGDYNREWV